MVFLGMIVLIFVLTGILLSSAGCATVKAGIANSKKNNLNCVLMSSIGIL
jgi:hypothetical protein